MITRLRHGLADDGVQVTLIKNGSPVASMMIPLGEARRFAWAVLADLDPDEVDAMSRPPRRPSIATATSVATRVLQCLAREKANSEELSAVLGVAPKAISGACNVLRARGHIVRILSPISGVKAVHAITDAGRRYVEGVA